MKLTIVIPVYNEVNRIEHTLLETIKYFKANFSKISYEILVVDANSPDKTASLVNKLARSYSEIKLLQTGKKRGKGYQVKQGILSSKSDYVMFMDADLATPLKYLNPALKALEKYPVVIGVRNLSSIHTGLRKNISEFGNVLVRVLLLPGVKDSQCGFKLFKSEAAQNIFSKQKIEQWGFDMEVLALAGDMKYKIKTIEIADWHDVMEGSKISGQNPLKIAIDTFSDLLKIKLNILFKRY